MASKVLVIGGGAAGLLAAGFAAQNGAQVSLLERNNILGKKIRITGKGRCNITNACELSEFINNYPGNGKFLYSALYQFSNYDVINFFYSLGVQTKEERGRRIFPVSDDADQVADALVKFVKQQQVQICLNTLVENVLVNQNRSFKVVTNRGNFVADRVIIATGGLSYPKTGSTGDGYQFAKQLGHNIVTPFPALVALRTKETWVKELSGLTLRNVTVSVTNGKEIHQEFGEMQFAHFGLTGPTILTLSRQAAIWLNAGAQVDLTIDLKPALDEKTLDLRLQRDFQKYSRKQFKNGLIDLLPSSLIPVIIELSKISPELPINQITKEARIKLVSLLKALPFSITKTLPTSTAIVTAGGVDVGEINPKTMESKLIPGLYFAGEVIDIDGVTGGFNLQAAFSTGYLAGINASKV